MPSLPQTKTCTKCGEEKPLDKFHRESRARDGRRSDCKDCVNRRNRKWRRENPEVVAECDRRWRKANREHVRKYRRRHYRENKNRILKRNAHYYQENRDAILKHRRHYRKRYYRENRESILERYRQHYRDNPEQYAQKVANRRARLKEADGSHTLEEWQALCERYDNRCLACGRDDVELTRDHVVPLTEGGTNDISNIQPLCLSCNCSKGTKSTDYRENP